MDTTTQNTEKKQPESEGPFDQAEPRPWVGDHFEFGEMPGWRIKGSEDPNVPIAIVPHPLGRGPFHDHRGLANTKLILAAVNNHERAIRIEAAMREALECLAHDGPSSAAASLRSTGRAALES